MYTIALPDKPIWILFLERLGGLHTKRGGAGEEGLDTTKIKLITQFLVLRHEYNDWWYLNKHHVSIPCEELIVSSSMRHVPI